MLIHSKILGRVYQEEAGPDGGGTGGGGGDKPPKPQRRLITVDEDYPHELREEARGWRLKYESAQKLADDATKTAAEAADAATKSANEAADAKVKEVTSTADQRVIRAELKALALKAGMHDLDALKLADLSGVKLDKDGEVVGAEEMMAALQKAKPYLFKEPSSSSGEKPPKPGDQKQKKVSEMTDDERKAEAKKRGLTLHN